VLSRPSRLLDRRPPLLSGQPLDPAPASHQQGVCFTRHQRSFTQFTPPVFPSPVAAWMAALGLSPGLRTPPTRSRRRTPRWGQANEHGPGTTRSTSHRSILQSVVHSQRATSRRTTTSRCTARRNRRSRQRCFCGGAAPAPTALLSSKRRTIDLRARSSSQVTVWSPWTETPAPRRRRVPPRGRCAPWRSRERSRAANLARRAGGGYGDR
jgi:hypothetical protein